MDCFAIEHSLLAHVINEHGHGKDIKTHSSHVPLSIAARPAVRAPVPMKLPQPTCFTSAFVQSLEIPPAGQQLAWKLESSVRIN